MPINASYEYFNAEKKYNQAQTLEEKISALKEMISTAPAHKGGENLRAELRLRMKKLLEKHEKSKKTGKTTKKSIRKEGFQVVLIGLPNSGKSSLLSSLTNAKPKISPAPFSTIEPEIGTMDYDGVKAQIVDSPSIGSSFFDIGLVNTADCLIIVAESLADIEKISPFLEKSSQKRIITLSKCDLLSEEQKRKLSETIKSRKINALCISSYSKEDIQKLKEKIFNEMDMIRVYTKEPGKSPTREPILLQKNSTVRDVAEKILKGFSQKVKESRVTGPSGKFPNQAVGLNHILKDKDIVEFKTR